MPVAAALILACVANAAPERADLLGALPGGVSAAAWWCENPERAFLGPHLERVWDRAVEAGVGEGLLDVVGELGGPEARAVLAAAWSGGAALAGSVDAGNLLREGAIGAGFEGSEPYACLVLRPADVDRAYEDVARLLAGVPGLVVREESPGKRRVSTPAGAFEVGVAGSCLVAAAGWDVFDRVAETCRKGSFEGGLWQNDKWRRAASHLPCAEDSAYFVDVQAIGAAASSLARKVVAEAPLEPDAREAISIVMEAVGALGITRTFSFQAGVSWTDGRVLASAEVTGLARGWRETPLGRSMAAAEPEPVPFEAIPGRATGVSFQTGADPGPIAEAVLGVLEARMGREALRQAKESAIGALGIGDIAPDLEGFLSGVLSGTQFEFTVPNMKPGLFGQLDQSVLRISLRDPDRFAGAVERIDAKVAALVRAHAGRVLSVESGGPSLGGFTVLRVHGLPIGGGMAWGVRDGAFYFASDSEVLAQSLSGENAGPRPFLWREDVARLGVIPCGPVYSFSYVDVGRFITNVSQVFTMAGLAAAFIPSDVPDAESARKVLAFIPRLAAPVRSLDFLGGMTSVTGFDARSGLLTSRSALEVPAAPGAAPPKAEGGKPRESF